MKTYTIIFNDNQNTDDLGFNQSLEFCHNYIKNNNGTDKSYFKDYKKGVVSILCHQNNQVVYSCEII